MCDTTTCFNSSQGYAFPSLGVADSTQAPIQVVSISAGEPVSADLGYTDRDRIADNNTYNTNLLTVKSAGNRGDDDGVVTAPGRGLNVLTVGDYDKNNVPLDRTSTSSFQNSTLGNEKPEISAPGQETYLSNGNPGLSVCRGAETCGTSAAAAHTSGFIANLIDSNADLRRNASLTKALMISGSTTSIAGGITKAGVGGIDYKDVSQHYETYFYPGGNNDFQFYDGQDSNGVDGWITESVWLNAGKPYIRAAINWLNRGTYTFDEQAMGMDFDLEVYDPSGNYIGGSHSQVNPFDYIDFTISNSGLFTFKIRRDVNDDTNADMSLALVVNSDD